MYILLVEQSVLRTKILLPCHPLCLSEGQKEGSRCLLSRPQHPSGCLSSSHLSYKAHVFYSSKGKGLSAEGRQNVLLGCQIWSHVKQFIEYAPEFFSLGLAK